MEGPAALAAPVFGEGAASDVFGVIHGLYWLTVNLADQRPLAILIDDIPWADDLSLRFFAYLDERLDDMPAPSLPRSAPGIRVRSPSWSVIFGTRPQRHLSVLGS